MAAASQQAGATADAILSMISSEDRSFADHDGASRPMPKAVQRRPGR
jgi:hypothetical protein